MIASDAARLLADVTDVSVELVGPLAGGEVGAFEVRCGPERWRGVLKYFESSADRAVASKAVRIAGRLRGAGYPAPRRRLVAENKDALILVFEWMEGDSVLRIDEPLVAHVLELNELQESAGGSCDGTDRWGERIVHLLRHGLTEAEGYCLHRPLARYSTRSARLLRDIRGSAEALRPLDLVDHQIAHCDFHHRNLLVSNRRISAVLDWDAARLGDPVFDLVTLAFCSATADRDPKAVAELREQALARRGPEVIRAYTAVLALRQVDWSIRHRSVEDVDLWLTASEAAMSALGAW